MDRRIETQDDIGLYVNFPVSEEIARAPSDPDAAARVLLLAEDILRTGKTMPLELARYLADAFGAAMRKPVDLRATELAFELNLNARNKRPSSLGWMDALRIIQANPGAPFPRLVELVMKQGPCSESHARRILKKAIKAVAEYEQILCNEEDS